MKFQELLQAFDDYKNEISKRKKELTPELNLLELIKPKELQLSSLIAEFLNPKGTHEQGKLFLQEFVNQFSNKNKKFVKEDNITVTTELAQNVDGRIDISIDFGNKFGIAIENKPFAEDQDEQIIRYVNYLKNTYGTENYQMIYLSRNGAAPTEKSLPENERKNLGEKFLITSFKDIRSWLAACSDKIDENSKRLKYIIDEIIDYINLEFLKTNKIKDKMINETIEQNILEAFEINKNWNENKDEFNKIWSKKINELFNKGLPKLVFNELINRNIINNDWKYTEGNFDINKKSVGGFKIKKENWKIFQYGILRSRSIINKKVNIFLAITTTIDPKKIEYKNKNYFAEYATTTNTENKNEMWSKPPIIWYSDFPNADFKYWGYDQWSEIKENGKTVIYIADFLEKLIKASEKDIENTENGNF